MDSGSSSWWGRHGWTVALLLTAFAMAFAIRTIFAYPIIQQFGNLYVYAGGSDSYYHSRVMQYIIANHTNLIFDPLLHYPIGAINPREPLFDWMNAILGIVFAPLFGGNAVNAGAFFLNLQAPLWAALTVFPIYLIGKEVGDRRTGLIAAIIFPFLPATINESIFGYANYLSFYTFVILVVLYSYIRLVKAVGSRRWVENYRSSKSIWAGLRGFIRNDRPAVKWAVFTGVAFGALALSWQGYTYVIAIIGVFIILAMVIERIRKIDSFGLYVSTWIVGLVGFPIAMPYYYFQHEFAGWFDLPLLLFFGILLLLLPFLFMRDLPWVVSIPTVVGVYLVAAAALFFVQPTYFSDIITGQGYFIKNLIYSTVAEAQAPSFDTLVISYGIVTFFLAFVGLGLVVWELVRTRFRRWTLVFLIFAVLSLYLPFSASKFLLLGAPAFALLPAEALRRFWDMGRYAELRQSMRSLTDTRSRLGAFRRSFKVRHILIILLVVGILVPNIWYGIDAGIPSNNKAAASTQVYDSIPSWLQPFPASQASSWYFGAAGSSLDTPNLYDSAAYSWLGQQDVATPEPQRPAFVSWWDYGFQAIDQGDHPAVADNFQNGIDPSGQFLLAQNQSIAIGVLAVTLLNAEQMKTGQQYLPSTLNQILAADGLNLSTLHNALVNESADYKTVVSNPNLYLPVNPSTLTNLNAMFMVASYYIAGAQSPNGVAKIYNDIMQYTGWSIRYSMTDSRLIPFSGTNTGIFYAPADLTGRVLDNAGNPETFFNVTVLGSDGNYYPEGDLPADVSAVQYYVNYYAPFYNSMIYHIYFGYNGTDIGLGVGIPGLLGSLTNYPVEPGWMESHFEVEYQTAYYCPTVAQASNQNCYYATNRPTALALQASQGGVADTNTSAYFSGGESILVYYPGQTMTGTVQLANGAPVAGARVTVFDSWGIPHQTVTTGPSGQYTVILPPGNDTVNVTSGTFQGLTQQGNVPLASVPVAVSPAVGFSFNAPIISRTITVGSSVVQGLVYWNSANESSYAAGDPVVSGATAVLWGVANGTPIRATTDAGGTFVLNNVAPGVYNYSVLFDGTNYTETNLYVNARASPVNASAGLTPANITGQVVSSRGQTIFDATVTVTSTSGITRSTFSNVTGDFSIASIGPGNYTVTATGPGLYNRSLGAKVLVTSIGEVASVNLTEFPSAPVTFSATANGLPLANIPIRVIPIPSGSNATSVSALIGAQSNATVLTTDSAGVISAQLPIGNYSLYALTYVSSSPYAAIGRVSVGAAGTAVTAPDLVLGPARWLTGTISSVGGGNASSIVTAYSPSGLTATVSTTNGSFALALPVSTYSLLTLQSPSGQSGATYADLRSVSLSASTSVSIIPTTSVSSSITVSTLVPRGGNYPASGANVTVSVGRDGPWVTAYTNAYGNVSFAVPGSLPVNVSYCVSASAVGYVSTVQCGISPSGLAVLHTLPIAFSPITVSVTVSSAPAGTPVTLNVTGTSATAGVYSVTGGPTFQLTVTPGQYTISGFAPGQPNLTQYRSGAPRTLSLSLGSTSASLSFPLILMSNTTGTLVLPHGMPAASVTVTLSSPSLNLSVNGTRFENGFYAAPGSYSAYAVGSYDGLNYTNLSVVNVPSRGASTLQVRLSVAGVQVNGILVATNGTTVRASTNVVFVAPSGAVAPANVTGGRFSATLPAGASYRILANFSSSVAGPNGSYTVRYTSLGAANSCTVGTTSTNCSVVLTATTLPVWFNGTLQASGFPGLVAGQLTLTGPYPSWSTTTVTASNGRFSVSVQPGAYYLYATSTAGANPLANLTTITVLPGTGSFVVGLSPTYTDRITVNAPTPVGGADGAQLLVRSASGAWLRFPSVAWGGTTSVALPVGVYAVIANATGAPYGAAANARASTSVSILSGNVATSLTLSYVLVYSVAGVATGPPIMNVPANGGSVSFSVGLTNVGNTPVTVHLVASPAYWNFTTTLTNVTLTPTGLTRNASGEVRFLVPAGTAVAHPGIVLSIELANGTILGNVTAVPTVKVAPSYGVAVAPLTSTPASVGLSSVRVTFTVANTGNIIESVGLSVVNRAHLASLGWNSSISSSNSIVTQPVVIGAGITSQFVLNVTQKGPAAIPPGTAVISATVVNASGSVQESLTLTIPTATVTVHQIVGVTGSDVGQAPVVYPQWLLILLALVPAIVVGLIFAVYRWNRSRRWRQW